MRRNQNSGVRSQNLEFQMQLIKFAKTLLAGGLRNATI
jgi:hypothetical protein